MFYSRTTIHTHTQCGLQIQNIIHKLVHFASETNTVCFTHTKKHIFSITKKYSPSTKKILQVQKTILQVRKSESCAWIWRHLRVDQQGGKLVPKVTWQINVLWLVAAWVAVLSQFKAARTIFFLPKIFIWCRPNVCGFNSILCDFPPLCHGIWIDEHRDCDICQQHASSVFANLLIES